MNNKKIPETSKKPYRAPDHYNNDNRPKTQMKTATNFFAKRGSEQTNLHDKIISLVHNSEKAPKQEQAASSLLAQSEQPPRRKPRTR